jgi:hypothetical protein
MMSYNWILLERLIPSHKVLLSQDLAEAIACHGAMYRCYFSILSGS